jgi:aminoglycoside 6'-N-acetyltransferase I
MKIRAARITDKPAWLALRRRLRPALRDQQHERDWLQMMEQRGQRTTLLCADEQGASLGMIEVSRRAQMEELGSGPVAYVDALHVEPGRERESAAQGLVDAAADWAQARGCRVLAADTSLDNQWEQKLHIELGFEEVARKVIYRRALAVPATVYQAVPMAAAPASLPMSDAEAGQMEESIDIDAVSGRWSSALRVAIIALGILSFYFTDVFSGDLFVGVLLPVIDVLFVIYLLVLFVGMKYRNKIGVGERQMDLYQASNDRE